MIQILKCGVFVSFLFVIFVGCGSDERDAVIDKLEIELAKHAARTDSFMVAANALTERIQQLNINPDSVQTVKRKVVAALLRVQNAALEHHQGLIRQNIQIDKMRTEINLLRAEPNRTATKVQLLEIDIKMLSATLRKQRHNIMKLETIIQEARQ